MSQNILQLISRLRKKSEKIDDRIRERVNLSVSEYYFLTNTSVCKNFNSNAIAKELGISLSRVSRIIEKLVVQGYLNRQTSSNDRRAIILCLTPKGEAVKKQILELQKEYEKDLLKQLSTSEQKQFQQITTKLLS